MKKQIYLLIFLVCIKFVNAQVIYEPFNSSKLGETREVKIQLPRGYDANPDKKYPIIMVFDGDYMFEAVSGNVDYYSYWEDMPDAIVVGVNQMGSREADMYYSEQNSLPIETGASFFEFIGMELIPHIEKTYRTEKFRVAIGHGETANFINYYLLKGDPIFKAYIAISPDLAPDMLNYIPERLGKIETKMFYYLATSENDVASINTGSEALNTAISGIDNKNILYNFKKLEDPTHYSLPAYVIPDALQKIFLVYQPISKKEYRETILELESSPVVYLEEKYQTILDLFGVDKKILLNDFKAIQAAIEKTEKFEYYEDLGKLARKQYPKTMLGSYYLARFYEETGETKKAMRTYQSAFVLEEIAGITKDLVLEKADEIKADFGY
ncbi:alpha/beta hydrolase-fold protein [Xanthomarina sp. F1114]|uniref:alpha/beta hydrolase n=1 Tax=Xanthomarina sp. F1114 TaxID=2996019 RepID=UPI00225DCE8F|nr:alpha/beta hydrolase-fold protein [Xanthomarina sp. F1114]MCX7546419.1 alpha/beta hydrolase-fold protein [Xanthomarina sp. F1114]